MSSRSIDITQINANSQNGKLLRVQSNAITFVDLYASNVIESGNTTTGNVFFTNTRAVGALTAGQNISISANGLITGDAQPFSGNTTNVPEGANLYFTNARVWAAISGNIDSLNNTLANLTTSNIAEGTNLYYTNARVYANVISLLLANNIVETGNTTTGNVFFTNARAVGALTGGTGITIASNGLIVGTSAFSGNTNLVPEGSANLYYTNARVYANVLDLLPNYTGNLQIGNANLLGTLTLTGNIVAATTGNGYLTGANLVQTNYIRANVWEHLFAANVVESGNTLTGNVFFTNARAIAALTGGSGISIAANGLIVGTGGYSNTDAYANLVAALPNYTGNLKAGNANILHTLYSGNIVTSGSTGGSITGANLIQTTYIRANVWEQLFASNVIENGNTLTGNVFFTNARAVAALTGGQNITIAANGMITGASQAFSGNTNLVPEGSANLYYTNARVYANVLDLLPNFLGNVQFGNANVTGTITAGNVVTGTGSGGSITGANLITTNFANVYNILQGNVIVANTWTNLFASNVIESGNTLTGNVFFTNARAVAALTGGSGISIAANGLIVGTGGYSSVDAYANLIAALPNYTGNLQAGNANILYTLVAANIVTRGSTGGTITGANLIQTTFLVTNTLTVNGVEIVNGTSGETNVITTRLTANIWNNLYTPNVVEVGNTTTGNVYFTNARAVAALTGGQNITIAANGMITGASQAFTGNTTNVPEGANLYYTNARAYANLVSTLPTYNGNLSVNFLSVANTLTAGNVVSGTGTGGTLSGANIISTNYANVNNILLGNVIVANVWQKLFAANVIESGNTLTGNVFFTNARVVAALTGGTGITIAANGLIVGSAAAGIYDNSNAYANLIAALPNYTGNLKAGNANILGTLFTGNIISATGIGGQITGANLISSNIITANTIVTGNGTGGNITGANLIVTSYIRANVWEQLFAANVIESGNTLTGNVFFTNARAVAALTGGSGITIAANGLIVSSSSFSGNTNLVPEGSANLYYTNARVYANLVAALPNYTGNLQAGNANILGTLYAGNANFTGTVFTGNIVSVSGVGGTISGANLISTSYLNANVWEKLYASNVIESGNTLTGNVFFTNARVVAALTGGTGITIASNGLIIGTGGYSSVDAYANLVAALPNYTGNLKAGNANITGTLNVANANFTGMLLVANIVSATGVGGTISGADTISTNIIVANTWTNLFASNVIESGNTLTGNVYFTNARAVAALTGGTGITIAANGLIVGTAGGNYDNTNAYANLIVALPNYTGNLKAGNANVLGTLYTGNIISAGGIGGAITGADTISSNTIVANTWTNLYASNVIESGNTLTGNVFFTNARAVAALTGGTGIAIAANGLIIGTGGYSSVDAYANLVAALPNYTGNLKAGNANVTGTIYAGNIISAGGTGGLITGANLISTTYLSANIWEKLYASNVIESGNTLTGNVYFTNARAVAALTGGTGITIASNGLIVGTSAFTGNTNLVPEGSANLYYTNSRVYANVIEALPNYTGNLKAGNANVTGTIYAGNIISAGGSGGLIDGANLISTTYLRANIWEKLYAANVIESGNTLTGNVFFSNARAVAALTGGTGITIASNGLIVSTASFTGNTNLVPEGSANLYFTNARVYANVAAMLPNYTGNVQFGNANITGTLYATNVISAGGTGGAITGTNLISTTYINANIWEKLYAANVIESGNTLTGNVFFTNARVVAALTGGTGITIASNGTITSTATATATESISSFLLMGA